MTQRPRNWVFLGDSLTEGVGSSRTSYVTEFIRLLRQAPARAGAIHGMRLREVEAETFNPFIRTNLAGFYDQDAAAAAEDTLWVWNLASEGQTIESDLRWLPWLRNLQPERVFVYRGSLESIVRPAGVRDGEWPAWMPAAWRNFVAMDPRCYFSDTWYRRLKQTSIDAVKQRVRLSLLAGRPGRPLIDADVLLAHVEALLKALRSLDTRTHVLGVIPPDAHTFPGSAEQFTVVNEGLRALAASEHAGFVDWAGDVAARSEQAPWRYRDGFHPNAVGARLMARILFERVVDNSD